MVFQGTTPLRGTRIFNTSLSLGTHYRKNFNFSVEVFCRHLLLTDAQSEEKGPSLRLFHDLKSRQ